METTRQAARVRVIRHLAHAPTSARAARTIVRAALGRWECPDLADDAELLASELVTNAVVHTRGEITLGVRLLRRGVRVEIRDDGSEDLPVPNRDLGATSGRGLHLVDALAVRWGTRRHRHGKTVWFELARR